jgi:hypothetical protein
MVTRLFSRTPLHEHPEAAQRVLGIAQLAPESAELAALLANDPAAEVRAAAAERCRSVPALASAWEKETDAGIRATVSASLGAALSEGVDGAAVRAFLESTTCPDAVRAWPSPPATPRRASRRPSACARPKDCTHSPMRRRARTAAWRGLRSSAWRP